MDSFKKRELYLHNKAIRTTREYLSIDRDIRNAQIVYSLACLQWVFAQEYRSEDSPYYVSKKRYTADLKKIEDLEADITEGAFRSQAVQAVSEAKEYLSLIAEYRIRDYKKCRVF